MIVLRWWLDTHILLIYLLKDKFDAYSNKLTVILEKNKVSLKKLKSVIGKFVHVSYAVLLLRHFLHNLHFKLKSLKKKNNRQ